MCANEEIHKESLCISTGGVFSTASIIGESAPGIAPDRFALIEVNRYPGGFQELVDKSLARLGMRKQFGEDRG